MSEEAATEEGADLQLPEETAEAQDEGEVEGGDEAEAKGGEDEGEGEGDKHPSEEEGASEQQSVQEGAAERSSAAALHGSLVKPATGIDEIDDSRKSAGVVVLKAQEREEVWEVPDEVRVPSYLWEGPCESSTSSSSAVTTKEGKETSSEEEEEEAILREEYIQLYKSLYCDKFKLRKKNIILQKHIHEYCKKRKLEVYFEDIETPDPKLETKYARQLIAFEEFLASDEKNRLTLKEDIEKLEIGKVEAEMEFDRAIEELFETERDVGSGLISSASGKPLGEKTLDKMLMKQRKTILELHETRFKYIKLRDSLAGKEATLRKLETFGEGLHLLDYEQLRMENQSYSDKIEERDEELTRLRNSATSSIQILAHIREKANSTSISIDDLYDDLEYLEMEAIRAREYTGDLKKQRDALRAQLEQMRKEAGLLVHQRLVQDFARRIEQSQALTVEIENLKNDFRDQNKRLGKVRVTIDALRQSDLQASFAAPRPPGPPGAPPPLQRPPAAAGKPSVERIKKGSPFFPAGKLSRIVKYVSAGKGKSSLGDA